jgi:apolipoprotein N-acyltransferase
MINLFLVVISALLFALANPGFFCSNGLSFVAWFYYIPVLFLVQRASYKKVWLYGGLYGVFSYCLYVAWLIKTYPMAMAAVCIWYFLLYALLFLLLKSADSLFEKNAWIVQWLILNAFEYTKTLGFIGFNYGITGYTQWKNTLLSKSSDLGGVWIVSAVVIFSSALIYRFIRDLVTYGSIRSAGAVLRLHRRSIFLYTSCIAGILLYGGFTRKNLNGYPQIQIIAVQHNTDPWAGGISAYGSDVENLKMITDRALAAAPDAQFVVWPETAVVPSVILHYNERRDRSRFELVKSLLDYINSKKAVFIIGNDNAVDTGQKYTTDYNSVLVFKPGINTLPPVPDLYAKKHLVPFTEYFPWPDQFPRLYRLLLNGDTHLWTPGSKLTVFHASGLSFSTPICFEDTFGNECRQMVQSGARVFINLSNDAWSRSRACQKQHLAMAVFRSMENDIPSVRSTASGETCIIAPDGRIIVSAPAFTQAYAVGFIPVIPENVPLSLYTRIGDLLGIIFEIAAAGSMITGCIATKMRMR